MNFFAFCYITRKAFVGFYWDFTWQTSTKRVVFHFLEHNFKPTNTQLESGEEGRLPVEHQARVTVEGFILKRVHVLQRPGQNLDRKPTENLIQYSKMDVQRHCKPP